MSSSMQSFTHRGSCAEWRIPPSRCHAHTQLLQPYRSCNTRRKICVTAVQQDQAAVFQIPDSRDEAVNVSVAAFLQQIKGSSGVKKKSTKGFGSGGSSSSSPGTRFTIELPLPSDSSADLIQLTADICKKLPAAPLADADIIFASEQAATAAAGQLQRKGRVLSLRDACRCDSLSGPVILVAPTTADVALVEQLVDDVWVSDSWVLLINPTWHTNTPADYQQLVDSFEAAYSFMPVQTQGLLRVEGAVLRCLSADRKSNSPWRVLVKEGEQFVQVGQMKKRPQQSDLELVFMNARAAKSPLTSFVKGVKGMLDKGKKQ